MNHELESVQKEMCIGKVKKPQWVGLRVGLDGMANRIIMCPCQESNYKPVS